MKKGTRVEWEIESEIPRSGVVVGEPEDLKEWGLEESCLVVADSLGKSRPLLLVAVANLRVLNKSERKPLDDAINSV